MQHNRLGYIFLLTFIIIFVTLISLITYPKYIVTNNELLINGDFSDGLLNWKITGKEDHIILQDGSLSMQSTSLNRSVMASQYFEGNRHASTYQLSGKIRTDNVIAGKENWQRAGLIMARYNEDGKRVGSYDVISLDGTRDWKSYKQIIELPPETSQFAVILRMLKATGTVYFDQISLKQVQPQTYYKPMRLTLITLWVALFFWIINVMIKRSSSVITILSILTCIIIALAGTLLPKEVIMNLDMKITQLIPETINNYLREGLDTVFPNYLTGSHQEISKLGHFLIFAILTLVTTIALRGQSIISILTSIILFAATTEVLQFLTAARSPHLYDFYIDSAGIFIGFLVGFPIRIILGKPD